MKPPEKTRLNELHTTVHQTTTLNKGLVLAEKYHQKNHETQESTTTRKPQAYFAAYNKNNPELFTEITKNLEKLKNNDKIEKKNWTR